MRPREIIQEIVSAIQSSGQLPSETNYVGYEPNIDTEAIKLPLIEVVTVSEARINDHNSDKQGVIRDDNGNAVAKVYHALYQLTLEVNVWTAHGSKHDPNVLGDSIYNALYPYDSTGPAQDLGDDIWRVEVGDGSPDEDFSTSPTLRRWSQEVNVWAYEAFQTDEDYIVNVLSPNDGDFSDLNSDGKITNTNDS